MWYYYHFSKQMNVNDYTNFAKIAARTPVKRPDTRIRRSNEYRSEELPWKAWAVILLSPLFVGVIFLVLLSF
jgi:hypothetical protein